MKIENSLFQHQHTLPLAAKLIPTQHTAHFHMQCTRVSLLLYLLRFLFSATSTMRSSALLEFFSLLFNGVSNLSFLQFLFFFHSCLIIFIHNSINSFTLTISQSNWCDHELWIFASTHVGWMRATVLGADSLKAHIYDTTVLHAILIGTNWRICTFRRSSHSSTFPAVHSCNTQSP